ncbi:MAG: hypothetical protein WBX20_08630 [Terrimicrobiaceae bacterium]
MVIALRDGFFGQPPEQLGGVQGTLSTYLEFFIDPEIAEVFCANEPTFSMDQIDVGKIVCIAILQKFQSERLYINTILKLSYYFHALSRFDKPAAEREQSNLIVLFADEGQEIITGAESAFADHRAAGIIREARATMVLATQASSMPPALRFRIIALTTLPGFTSPAPATSAIEHAGAVCPRRGERLERRWQTPRRTRRAEPRPHSAQPFGLRHRPTALGGAFAHHGRTGARVGQPCHNPLVPSAEEIITLAGSHLAAKRAPGFHAL